MGWQTTPKSFDDLRDADLQEVYDQSKQEALRDYAFRMELDAADSLGKLKAWVFDGGIRVDRRTARELLEISNRFRLFDAPEYEIRLYEESQNAEFQDVPRAKEFYLLALNKVGRTIEAIAGCKQIIAEGNGNGLVWGILGNAYSVRMLCAENFATALEAAGGDLMSIDPHSRAAFIYQFPHLDVDKVRPDQIHSLRRQLLDKACETYRHGFEQYGTAFPGLCWMIRTIDRYADLLTEKALLLKNEQADTLDARLKAPLLQLETQLNSLKHLLSAQPDLLHVALEMEGGHESLDFWPHSGELQLAFFQGCGMMEVAPILARVFASLDAGFKLKVLHDDLSRIRDQHVRMRNIARRLGEKTSSQDHVLKRMESVLAELSAGHDRFIAGGKIRGAALNDFYHGLSMAKPRDAKAFFLQHTINFRALTNSLLPQFVQGGIGRVGARVPDLIINRNVQEDLYAIITEKVLPALSPASQKHPRTVLDIIQRLVGKWLDLSELQDLQSPAHQAFETRSDGLILLSGIDPAMRVGCRSITALTAALLLRTGDCRETMYLNGALFACYQHIQVIKKLGEAIKCLQRGDTKSLHRINQRDIFNALRYQLRGGHVAVYVDGIAMRHKYRVERFSPKDPTPAERRYGIEEFRAGKPLSRYELENSKILLKYLDGTMHLIEPRDPINGKWRPIENLSVNGGGIPCFPETGQQGGAIADLQLLNLVEEHSLCFLYDKETENVEICDGFYNEHLFDSPYRFGSAHLEIQDILKYRGLIRAGTRPVRATNGKIRHRQVFVEFLPYSATDCQPALNEGDLPNIFQLMGRLFKGKLHEERRRLEDGISSVPTVLAKMQTWQLIREFTSRQAEILDQRFVRVLLSLARDRPELVTLQDVKRERALITQGQKTDSVYLVLSGEFQIFQNGALLVHNGRQVKPAPGTVLGEISALQSCLPTATVVGDGVVLRIAKDEFLRQLDINPVFRDSVEELVTVRQERDRLRQK